MNKLYFEYYVPFISCCTPFFFLDIVIYFCPAALCNCTYFLFFCYAFIMSCNNIVITMGGQLRQAQASLATCHLVWYCCVFLYFCYWQINFESGIGVSPSDADTVIRRSRRSLPAEHLQRSAGKTTTPKPRSAKKSPSALSNKQQFTVDIV